MDPHSPLSTQLGNNTNVVVWLRVTDRNSASPSSLLVLDYLHAHFQVSNWDERPDAEPLRFAGYHNRLLNPLYTQPRNEGHRLSFDSGSCLHGWVNIPLLDYDDHWRLEYRDDFVHGMGQELLQQARNSVTRDSCGFLWRCKPPESLQGDVYFHPQP